MGAGDLTIAAISIVAMDQLTIILQDNTIAHKATGSFLALPHDQQAVLGSKEIVFLVILVI
jgi:hypothetical protein